MLEDGPAGSGPTGMAGVANVGSDRNWTGSDFDQANWYAFGRLAWNPEASARDIAEAPEATIRHYGHSYVHPYTASEYPDSMVQLITVSSLHEYGVWRGKPLPLEKRLAAGIGRFFGPVRATVPLVAGMMGMHRRRFQIANILSAIIWAPVVL